MGKKSKARGRKAPRPLGTTGETPHHPHVDARLAREECIEIARALAEGRQDVMLDSRSEVSCHVEEDNDDDSIPTIDPSKLERVFNMEEAPSDYRPSVESVWLCARNDFSGQGLLTLLRHGGIYRYNDWHKHNRSTPVSVCCSRGNLEGLKAIIQVAQQVGFQLDASKKSELGAEPLFYAVQSRGNNHALGSVEDFCEIIKLLVTQLGRDIECIPVNNNSPPTTGLVYACELGERKLVETCLELGADVNRPSPHNNGMTPLHFAVKSGSTSITQMLLDRGANTRAVVQQYVLPISYCLSSMNFACADLILRHEADLEAQGKKLPPLTQEMELYSNIQFIQGGVEEFRRMGNVSGSIPNARVVDIRSDQNARIYDEQAKARARSRAHNLMQCDGCGAYGAAMKRCAGCSKAVYCDRTCQQNHWKEHKGECKTAQAQRR